MRNAILKAGALSIASLLMVFTGTAFATGENAVIVGGSFAYGPDTEASVIMVEYERMLNDGLSVLGRIGNLDYEYDDGYYVEEGDGPGFEAGVRIYPAGNGMKGFYYGAAAGLWLSDWTWTEPGFSGEGGFAINAQLKSPYRMVFDKEGNLYFTDRENNRVRKIDKEGKITTLAGNSNLGWMQDALEVRITVHNFP